MIVGIDPGKKGAATFMLEEGEIVDIIEYSKNTPHEISDAFLEFLPTIKKAYLEFVCSRPGQSSKATFTFGANYGFWQGILTAFKIPYEVVTPLTWQRKMGCLSKGNKNVTKAKAQQLFPKQQKITHGVADSILIAEYGRRAIK